MAGCQPKTGLSGTLAHRPEPGLVERETELFYHLATMVGQSLVYCFALLVFQSSNKERDNTRPLCVRGTDDCWLIGVGLRRRKKFKDSTY